MNLSNNLIYDFAKLTTINNTNSESTVYGIIVEYGGDKYVQLDGSDLLTPIETTADVKVGERVTITIKNHTALVNGNITSPSASSTDLKEVGNKVDTLEVNYAEVNSLVANKADITDLTAVNARIDTITAGAVTTEQLNAVKADINNLDANKANITDLTAANATIAELEAGVANINNLVAKKADITELTATNAKIDTLQSNKADITELNSAVAEIVSLESVIAGIDNLISGNLTSDNISSLNLNASNTTIDNAMIKDAMIDSLSANKITTGVINTNNVTIKSSDGSMILQGTILQMKDQNGKVRIQLGKDNSGKFTFVLYDSNGTGVLIDETGIKSSDAIKDGLIKDTHVSDNANIQGSKLDIASVITEVNNDNSTTIKSNKIYLNEQKQSLEVAFNSLKTKVDTIQEVTINGDLSGIVEQVQSNTTQINANKEGISTLVSQNTQRKEEITNLTTNLNTVNTTLTTKYSSLEQNLSGFKTTVNDTYTTKTEFNALSIGATNLIKNSDFSNGTTGWLLHANCTLDTSEKPYSIKSAQSGLTSDSWRGCRSDYWTGNYITLKKGVTYTASCYYLVSKDTSSILDRGIALEVKGMTTNDANASATTITSIVLTSYTEGQWVRMSKTFTPAQDYYFAHIYAYVKRNGKAWFTQFKLEEGSKLTSWSPAPEDTETKIDNLNASITTTYATKSELTQSSNDITAKFTSSGGYNLIENSSGQIGTGSWINVDSSYFNQLISPDVQKFYSAGSAFLMKNDKTTESFAISYRFLLKPNTTYTLSGKYCINAYCKSVEFYILMSNSIQDIGNVSVGIYDTSYLAFTKEHTENGVWWKSFKYTFTTGADCKSGCIRVDNGGTNMSGYFGTVYFGDLLLVEGSIAHPWSPHPNECSSGIVRMSRDGIKVSQTGYSGYTNMRSDGLYVYDGKEDVIKCTANGLEVKGKITATNGSIGGSTTIDGNCITTGTLTADHIKGNSLTGTTITGGTIKGSTILTGDAYVFKDTSLTGIQLEGNYIRSYGNAQVVGSFCDLSITSGYMAMTAIDSNKRSLSHLYLRPDGMFAYRQVGTESEDILQAFVSISNNKFGYYGEEVQIGSYYIGSSDPNDTYTSKISLEAGDVQMQTNPGPNDNQSYSISYTYDSSLSSPVFGPLYAPYHSYYLGSADKRWYQLYCKSSPNVSSDRNVKTNIEYISSSITNEKAITNTDLTLSDMYNFVKDDLSLSTYNYIQDVDAIDDEVQLGFIAQDLIYNSDGSDNVVGQIIVNAKRSFDTESDLSYNSANYTNVLAGALKYAINKIEELEKKLNEE